MALALVLSEFEQLEADLAGTKIKHTINFEELEETLELENHPKRDDDKYWLPGHQYHK
jgi:hypothetical protein